MRGQGACFGVYSGKKVTLNQKFPIVSMKYVDVEARVPRVFRAVPGGVSGQHQGPMPGNQNPSMSQYCTICLYASYTHTATSKQTLQSCTSALHSPLPVRRAGLSNSLSQQLAKPTHAHRKRPNTSALIPSSLRRLPVSAKNACVAHSPSQHPLI